MGIVAKKGQRGGFHSEPLPSFLWKASSVSCSPSQARYTHTAKPRRASTRASTRLPRGGSHSEARSTPMWPRVFRQYGEPMRTVPTMR